ncbi:MAG: F0F1 ATP synthase subunit A [Oscillospiraceae bacterium]|nr:F0F1 ATP synthase subunit A [Oscillospiraceae bacterium]
MEVNINGPKILFELPFVGAFTQTILNTWIIMAIIVGLCIWLTRDLKVHPTSKRQIVAEFLVKAAYNMVEGNMGKRFSFFTPYFATLIAFLALSNLSGLTGFYAPTADLSTEAAFALATFAICTFYKLKLNGFVGYLKSFGDPIVVMYPFNVLGEIANPLSLACRHFGNVVSGSVIGALIYGALAVGNKALFGLLPGFLGELLGMIPFLQVGIPAVASIYFDVFSGCLQAYIFCVLSMMYIQDCAGGPEAE